MTEPGLAEKVALLHEALRRAGIAHAFGGALALAYYSEPRATVDIDVNVFLSPDRFDDVRAALATLGLDRFPDAETIRRDGQGRAWWGHNPVDLFFAYDPVHDAMRRDARTVPFGEQEIPILSVEHLSVAKVAYNRPKDWIDLEQVLTANPALDVGEAERWLEHLMGTGDPRYGRFRELVTRCLGEDRTV